MRRIWIKPSACRESKKEAGMALGWPLGLCHDATGWPLGLRLRLTQEDSQWPQESPLDDSPSYSSNSSSLDSQSTRSFSQDKNMSLEALMGLPLHHPRHPSAAGNGSDSRVHRRNKRNSRALRVFPASSSSGSRSSKQHRHHHQHRKGAITRSRSGSGLLSSHGSNRPPSRKANSLRWALLSILSCARVPSPDEAGCKWSKSSAPSCKSACTGASEFSTSNPPGIQCAVPFIGRRPSPVRRLYDNIMFEESMDRNSPKSSKWNPLFASSSLADGDELEEVDSLTDSVEHMRVSLMRSRSSYSDLSSDDTDWSSACDSFDRRNAPSSTCSRDGPQLGKSQSAIHLFLSRMACCRHPQTLDT